jgi:hypothetical protein
MHRGRGKSPPIVNRQSNNRQSRNEIIINPQSSNRAIEQSGNRAIGQSALSNPQFANRQLPIANRQC